MGKILKFPENENSKILELANSPYEPPKITKKWEEYSKQEKIDYILKNQCCMKDYVEYATHQRYYKQFDDSIVVIPYQLWVKKLVEDERV